MFSLVRHVFHYRCFKVDHKFGTRRYGIRIELGLQWIFSEPIFKHAQIDSVIFVKRLFCSLKTKLTRSKKNLPSFTLSCPFGTWRNAIDCQKQHLRRYDAMKCFNVAKDSLVHSLLQIEFVIELLQRQQAFFRQRFVDEIVQIDVQVIILWQLCVHKADGEKLCQRKNMHFNCFSFGDEAKKTKTHRHTKILPDLLEPHGSNWDTVPKGF